MRQAIKDFVDPAAGAEQTEEQIQLKPRVTIYFETHFWVETGLVLFPSTRNNRGFNNGTEIRQMVNSSQTHPVHHTFCSRSVIACTLSPV